MTELEALTLEIKTQLADLSEFTATPGAGVTRFPFTTEAKKASDYIAGLMEQADLAVRLDNSGSVIGRLEGEVPETIMIGSHLDSVQNGGAYDGIAGVVCAIQAVKKLTEKPHYSIEVIATNDEEGSRFKSGLFTGKVLLGKLTPTDIRSYRDAQGISVYEAMEGYGLKPEEIADHKRTDIVAFLEIHIEQGPKLEAVKKDIGLVDTIVGIRRAVVTVEGRADHIGTMPMDMRRDALNTAAKVIANISDRAEKWPEAVATVGNLTVEPNIINIIPERVTFTADFRAVTQSAINEQYDALDADLEAVSAKHGTKYSIETTLDVPPVDMSEKLVSLAESACEKRGYSHMHLCSGAGHDAQVFGAQLPAMMLFVPSIGGRSHCPEEKSDEKTLAMASLVAADVIKEAAY